MIQRKINGNVNHNEEDSNVTEEDTQSLNDEAAGTAEYDIRTELNISVGDALGKGLDIVNELNEICKLKENCEGIMFKKS